MNIFTFTTVFRSLSQSQTHQNQNHIFRVACFHLWNHMHLFIGNQHWKGNTSGFLTSAIPEDYPREKPNLEHEYYSGVNVSTLYKEGKLKQALDILLALGVRADGTAYADLLHGCAKMKALGEGQLVHGHMIKTGFEPDIFVGNHLTNMYVKCGSLGIARQVFDKMPKRNVVSWTAMIAGFIQHGHGEAALEIFSEMQEAETKPNQFTFASVLSTCASLAALEYGEQVHVHTIKTGFESNVFVGNALVSMYAKCGSIEDAKRTFEEMPKPDLVSRSAMIAGYAQHVEDEQKEQFLCHHSEKLAIAFGLISTTSGIPIRIIKNLRVCGDCHNATKFISKIVGREIVVRDTNRFHHFKDGVCSCWDYW